MRKAWHQYNERLKALALLNSSQFASFDIKFTRLGFENACWIARGPDHQVQYTHHFYKTNCSTVYLGGGGGGGGGLWQGIKLRGSVKNNWELVNIFEVAIYSQL